MEILGIVPPEISELTTCLFDWCCLGQRIEMRVYNTEMRDLQVAQLWQRDRAKLDSF